MLGAPFDGDQDFPRQPELLTGVIAAEVFIVGFILSGTAADFKEAERLPGEVAGSLESVTDECLIMDAELKLPEARQCVSLLADTGMLAALGLYSPGSCGGGCGGRSARETLRSDYP